MEFSKVVYTNLCSCVSGMFRSSNEFSFKQKRTIACIWHLISMATRYMPKYTHIILQKLLQQTHTHFLLVHSQSKARLIIALVHRPLKCLVARFHACINTHTYRQWVFTHKCTPDKTARQQKKINRSTVRVICDNFYFLSFLCLCISTSDVQQQQQQLGPAKRRTSDWYAVLRSNWTARRVSYISSTGVVSLRFSHFHHYSWQIINLLSCFVAYELITISR